MNKSTSSFCDCYGAPMTGNEVTVRATMAATVVEVECLDRPGLLYDVTQALFESGLSIATAMVATYGERAVDVFYVRDGFGHKIIHPERLAAIEARLNTALAGRPEAIPL